MEVLPLSSLTAVQLSYSPQHGAFALVPRPDYLLKEMEEFLTIGDSGLAIAFLMHLEILKKESQYPDCTCGVSPDGRHILFSAKKGPLAGLIIYGDLVTKQTVRWKMPKGLTPHDLHEFVWVVTP